MSQCVDCGAPTSAAIWKRCKPCSRKITSQKMRAWHAANPGGYRLPTVDRYCLDCGVRMVAVNPRRRRCKPCAAEHKRKLVLEHLRSYRAGVQPKRNRIATAEDQPAHVIEAAIRDNQARIDAARRNGTPVFSTDPWAQRPDWEYCGRVSR